MKNKILIISFFIPLLISCENNFAQPKIVDLWKGHIPGSIIKKDYIEDTAVIDGRTRISHVSNPTLTIFSPEKDKNKRAAVLLFPGGGYGHLAIETEGDHIAKWLNENGITAVIVKYRLPNDAIMEKKSIAPLQDAQEAMRFIRRIASELNIDKNKIGIMGFSAGGHLASTLSTHFNEKVYDSGPESCRPDFAALIYPVISMGDINTHTGSRRTLIKQNASQEEKDYFSNELHVNQDTPPTFLVHSGEDNVVPVQNSIEYYLKLQKNKISSEMHIFNSGGHGFGIDLTKGNENQWALLFINWLKQMKFIQK